MLIILAILLKEYNDSVLRSIVIRRLLPGGVNRNVIVSERLEIAFKQVSLMVELL